MKCPYCGESDDRVILRLHWSKRYHEFICGHCKLEFDFLRDPHMNIDTQLDQHYLAYIDFEYKEEIDEMAKRVGKMTTEQMKERLEAINKKIKKGKK